MPLPRGAYYRYKVYPSGRKVKLTISSDGRILETIPIQSRVSKTRTSKRLSRRRKKINR